MAKYEPLCRFLRRHHHRHGGDITLTFAEVERIIGACLPKAASEPQWWLNEPGTDRHSAHHDAWLKAGYLAFPGLKESVSFQPSRLGLAARMPITARRTRPPDHS